jgi:hypothetical protein
VAQRDVEDVMRGQAHLFGQAQRVEARAVDDGVAHGARRPVPVAVPAPQRQDGERRVDLAQMGERAGGAGGMAAHRPTASPLPRVVGIGVGAGEDVLPAVFQRPPDQQFEAEARQFRQGQRAVLGGGEPAHIGEDLDPRRKRRLVHRADQPVDQRRETVERLGIHLRPVGTRGLASISATWTEASISSAISANSAAAASPTVPAIMTWRAARSGTACRSG